MKVMRGMQGIRISETQKSNRRIVDKHNQIPDYWQGLPCRTVTGHSTYQLVRSSGQAEVWDTDRQHYYYTAYGLLRFIYLPLAIKRSTRVTSW
jgi:hypothetical protein